MAGGEGGFDVVDKVEVEAVGVVVAGGVPAGVLEEGLGDGEGLPGGWGAVEGAVLPGEAGGAAQLGGEGGEEGLGVGEDVEVVGVGAVPFEHGEFGVVPAALFAGAEAGAELEYAGVAGGEEAFHGELGGGAEPAVGGGDGVYVFFGGVGGEQDGGGDFEEVALAEEAADGVVEACALFEDGALIREGGGVQGVGGGQGWRTRSTYLPVRVSMRM